VTENYTQNDGSIAYKLAGLSVEILNVVCEKMNTTIIFLAPSLNWDLEDFLKSFGELDESLSDVLTGSILLIPAFVTSSFDATIPYNYDNAKMLVPCPKAIPATEKVLTTFSLSVWLTIGLVLLLTTAVFWCAGNGPYRSVCNQTHSYRSLSNCFHNAWAIFMAVSGPQQPTNSSLRVFFILYVCFCVAISTVVQAFFVSYLLEPKYGKKLETLDELQNSDVVFGYNPIINFFAGTLASPEIVKFLEKKTQEEDCSDLRKCVERMITKRDIATLSSRLFDSYVAREIGTVDVSKTICYLDETFISFGVTVLLKNGNPLLNRFKILMRRYLEAGFQERIWTELHHRASLRGGRSFRKASGNMFFPFSVSHLMPAFVVMFVGTVSSSVVFIAELIVKGLCKRREKRRIHTLEERECCISVIAHITDVYKSKL
jgi:hypothetical protein